MVHEVQLVINSAGVTGGYWVFAWGQIYRMMNMEVVNAAVPTGVVGSARPAIRIHGSGRCVTS